MFIAKKIACAFTGVALCSMLLLGCSEEQGKKQDKKVESAQERQGTEAAKNLQKPLEDARKAAQLGTERVQNLSETAPDGKPAAQTGGKEKKKLEGC